MRILSLREKTMKLLNTKLNDKVIFLLCSILYVLIQSYSIRTVLGSSIFSIIILINLCIYSSLLYVNELKHGKIKKEKITKTIVISLIIVLFNIICIYFVFNGHLQAERFTRLFSVIECILNSLVFFVFYAMSIWKSDLRRIFMICLVTLGSVMMICMPIGAIPDEPQHMRWTYSVSNIIMNKNTIREDDYLVNQHDYWTGSYQDIGKYEIYLHDLVAPLSTKNEIQVSFPKPSFFGYVYIVPALGFSVGRLFGLGTGLTLLLGRIANFIVFCLIINKSIKLIPVGKEALFTYCLLPMTLHQAISISYDSILFALSAYCICFSIKTIYDNRTDLNKHEFFKNVLKSLFVFIFIFGIKSHAYMLIGILPLLVTVLIRYENIIVKKSTMIKKLILCGLLILCSGYIVFYLLGFAVRMYHPTIIDQFGTITPEESYSVSYMLAFPVNSFKMLFRTLIISSQWYIETMIGKQLGWLNLMMPEQLIIIFIIILLLSGIRRPSENVSCLRFSGIFLIIFALTIANIICGMAIAWTPISSSIVQGVQGRYFSPILLIPLILEKKMPIRITSINSDGFILALTIVSTFSLQYLLIRL